MPSETMLQNTVSIGASSAIRIIVCTSTILADTQGNNSWNLNTGALTMKNGSINIGSGVFQVDSNGNLTATSANIQGVMSTSYTNTSENATYVSKWENGVFSYSVNGSQFFRIDGRVGMMDGNGSDWRRKVALAGESRSEVALTAGGYGITGINGWTGRVDMNFRETYVKYQTLTCATQSNSTEVVKLDGLDLLLYGVRDIKLKTSYTSSETLNALTGDIDVVTDLHYYNNSIWQKKRTLKFVKGFLIEIGVETDGVVT